LYAVRTGSPIKVKIFKKIKKNNKKTTTKTKQKTTTKNIDIIRNNIKKDVLFTVSQLTQMTNLP
jgi:hypothetical protein